MKPLDPLSRRRFLAVLGASAATLALPARAAYEAGKFRIGYQKAASTLVLAKANGSLEARLRPLGVEVTWAEFAAGPQLLEGLNVGAIDFGYVGEAPPVFAQAAGADFVYSAYEIPTPLAEGVVVANTSPIKTVADLKRRKVAFNKGSDVHWFLVALLRKHGLDFGDIDPVYLAPADARAALERGSVDAWAIWDPFLSAVLDQSPVRLLANAEGVADHHQFFLSQRTFASKRPDVVKATLESLGETGQQIRADYAGAAAKLAPIQGLDAKIIEKGLRHYAHRYQPVSETVLAAQQRIADTFLQLKLIPRPIRVADATLPHPVG
ncbi:aliphatic sulfonate ABC transporter substrate-binding protein [Pandoraea apista]|uniref:Aliphatic sulfonate ABC transporter substrate-binding protein n=1 Tax=Pandoraea apista TaxID=93218 RepID=A0ABX9ZVE4_9BURK|nr:sulfonate ABC transporter substrate-binding protein [Pandoraea apista]AKH75440.1 sulfonate ABC transporter substrate-binding protein [Pandoraea apista]AKI64796.1 sulfonate ABC transporter substrate-binding protein [Pandoraea apista]AVF42707.1 aliphatic sulfonate ABC transporter substrate-binding protein [Pandoraea apista]PTE02093.1 aliphatic sulfonate ABC transporter substrate-binding protein [Pandoraea apista]